MCRFDTWGAWAVVLGVFVWTEQSSAEPDTRVHLGLDTSIYSNTSIDGTTNVSGTGGSSASSTKAVANSSQVGFPGNTTLTLGALFNDAVDLGARFGYQSSTTKVGSGASTPERTTSVVTASPYIAYLAGSREDSLRFTMGIFGGIGSGTTEEKQAGTGGTASTSTEATLTSTEYGAFMGLRGFTGNVMSLDPMILLARNSSTYKFDGNAEVDLTGVTFMLNIGFTLWTGGSPTPIKPAAARAPAAQNSDTEPPSEPRPLPVPADKSYRITLNLDEGRKVTLVGKPKSEDPDVVIGLRDGDNDIRQRKCTQITFHAPNHEDIVIDVESAMASNATRRYPVLKGLVPIEVIRRLVVAPTASDAAAPDHWIDVCEQKWHLLESERRRLKKYAMGLPKVPPKPAPATEPAAPATEPAAPATEPAAPLTAPAAPATPRAEPAKPAPLAAPLPKAKK